MRLVLILVISLGYHSVISQSVNGWVVDQNENSLQGVTVINQTTKVGTITNVNGQFGITAKQGEILRFSYIGAQTKYYTIQPKDSSFLVIVLKEDLTQLKEFVVDGKRIKEVSAEENDNILDYYSLGKNTFLVLKKKLRDYQLTIEGVDTVYKTYPINDIKPKSLFLDVFGNFHLVCTDSIRQIYIADTLQIITVIDEKTFKNKLFPLIITNDSLVVRFDFSNHNKKYLLSKLQGAESKVALKIFSELEENVARHNYSEIIALYHATAPFVQNIILHDSWNGDVLSLAINDDLIELVSEYKNLRAKEIKVETFAIKNSLLTFDFLNDSLTVQNINGDRLHQTKLTVSNKGFTKEVVLDRDQNIFYAYSLNSGIVTLDKLNLQTGTTTESYELKGVTYPKNLKVIDGWAYFINLNKNGFHKLYRIELR